MITATYLRIQGREISPGTGKPAGVFASCWRLIRAGRMSPEQEARFHTSESWFKKHLPEPEFYREGNPQRAVTWFRGGIPDEMEEMLRPMLAIFDEVGYAYDIVYTDSPGTVVYEDDYQVAVAD